MKKINQEELNILIDNHNLYIKTLTETDKKGKKLILDEVDFTGNDLSKLNFLETYITSSVFKTSIFKNQNFSEAGIYDCYFENVVFENCVFGKTVLDYTQIVNSQFINCELSNLDTLESNFQEVSFKECSLNGAFSSCIVNGAEFEECTFLAMDFWKCIINKIKMINKKDGWSVDNIIQEINKGTIDQPDLIRGKEAVKYFESKFQIRTK